MFEYITDTQERGQVGIGTLIVFIAMVLVAAIAAGVLINTAGFLQTQAEATGQDSTDLVSERIDVSSSVGIVDSASDGILEQVRLTASGAPGASDIDLADTTIQAVGPGGQQNLVFASGDPTDNDVSVPSGVGTLNVPAEINENSDTIEIGVGEIPADGYTLEVSDGSTTADQTLNTGDGQDVVGVGISALSYSDGDSLDITLIDDGTTTADSGTTSVVSVVSNDVSTPGEDEIDAPAEIDEDATDIDIGVGSLTDGDTIRVSGENGEDTFTPTGDGVETFTLANVDPAESDSLEITLEDSTNSNEVLDSETTTVVDTVQSISDLRADEFTIEDDGTYQENAVLGDQDQYTIVLNPQTGALENTGNPNDAFGQGDSATLDLVSPAGATTQVELRAPDLFNENGQAVRL